MVSGFFTEPVNDIGMNFHEFCKFFRILHQETVAHASVSLDDEIAANAIQRRVRGNIARQKVSHLKQAKNQEDEADLDKLRKIKLIQSVARRRRDQRKVELKKLMASSGDAALGTKRIAAIRGRQHAKGTMRVMQERFKLLFDSAVDAFMFLDHVCRPFLPPSLFHLDCSLVFFLQSVHLHLCPLSNSRSASAGFVRLHISCGAAAGLQTNRSLRVRAFV